MANALRWTPEQLAEYERKSRGVKTNLMEGSRPDRKHEVSKESKLERRFVQQLGEAGITYQRNYFPIDGRDWELDFVFDVQRKLAVEIDGMAHRIKGRFKRDAEKHATLLLAGWKVLRVVGDDVRSGRAIEWTKALIKC